MTIDSRRVFRRCCVSIGLLVATMMVGLGGYARAESASNKAKSAVAEWPEASRLTALAMIERHGHPDRIDDNSLTWIGIYHGKRTVVHSSDSGEGIVEQVAIYPIPAEKVDAVTAFDKRINVDRASGELSARADDVRTDFLLLNLAHEVASGFKDTAEAQAFRDKQLQLAEAGKSSRYRSVLIFEQQLSTLPTPFVLPAGVNPPQLNSVQP